MENNQNELRELVKLHFIQQKQAAAEIGMSHVTFNIFLKGGKIPERHLPKISAWLESKAQKKLPIG